ncbi:hypothetical protein Dda_9151 [Drechslerella dactyloides]|uniref:Uncharacterized protein n=1 Tax=Drechslerella dactyloides TaxID=74499 RepID=A0AAD6NFD3_DREDA|nr:hypothetical protein Dda_9151 [Drechslerella dactyloides]
MVYGVPEAFTRVLLLVFLCASFFAAGGGGEPSVTKYRQGLHPEVHSQQKGITVEVIRPKNKARLLPDPNGKNQEASESKDEEKKNGKEADGSVGKRMKARTRKVKGTTEEAEDIAKAQSIYRQHISQISHPGAQPANHQPEPSPILPSQGWISSGTRVETSQCLFLAAAQHLLLCATQSKLMNRGP